MPKIRLIAQNYEAPYLDLNTTSPIDLDVSQLELMWASLTIGFQRSGDVWRAGFPFWYHRLGLGISATAFLESDSDAWCLGRDYAALDLSEKSAMSYWQGMIFAKIAAARHLNVPWLAHVDDMKLKKLLKTSETTKRRGDLVGRDTYDKYHVIEAKGRSQRAGADLVQQAKDQAAAVTSIKGHSPATTSACISKLWKCPIEVLLDDPPVEGNAKEVWSFEENDFWRYYYSGVSAYIRKFKASRPLETPSSDNVPKGYSWAPVNSLPFLPFWYFPYTEAYLETLWIGLPHELMKDPSIARKVFKEGEIWTRSEEGDSVFVAKDHIAMVHFVR